MNKIFSLMATFLTSTLLMTGCLGNAYNTPPSKNVHEICRAYIYGDESKFEKTGITKEEYENNFLAAFAKNFAASKGLDFTPEQIAKISDATKELLKRASFGTADVEKGLSDATVKIHVDTLKPFDNDTFIAKLPANFDSLSKDEQTEITANTLVEFLKEWQYSGNAEFIIECKYNDKEEMWMPAVDAKEIGKMIITKIFDIK